MTSLLPVVLATTCAMADPPPTTTTASTTPSVPSASYLALNAPERRVRAPEARVQSLLAYGFQRSPTFASLLLALNKSDVIVYIESIMTLPKETMGRITIVPIAGKERYLRVQIRADLPRRDAIALIGHEMWHALEIAQVPDARNADGLIRLYERIGHSSGAEHSYDTSAARDTGRKILSELAG
jgi:hypothetical protein